MASRRHARARAPSRYLGVSPHKVRQVLDLVAGLPVDDAMRDARSSASTDAADDVLKLLDSAIANAEHNQQLPGRRAATSRAAARDEGPTCKSGPARARGRYFRIRKRTSHVTIIVARYDDDELGAPAPREEPSRRRAARRRTPRAGRASAPIAPQRGRRARPRPRPRPRSRRRPRPTIDVDESTRSSRRASRGEARRVDDAGSRATKRAETADTKRRRATADDAGRRRRTEESK